MTIRIIENTIFVPQIFIVCTFCVVPIRLLTHRFSRQYHFCRGQRIFYKILHKRCVNLEIH